MKRYEKKKRAPKNDRAFDPLANTCSRILGFLKQKLELRPKDWVRRTLQIPKRLFYRALEILVKAERVVTKNRRITLPNHPSFAT